MCLYVLLGMHCLTTILGVAVDACVPYPLFGLCGEGGGLRHEACHLAPPTNTCFSHQWHPHDVCLLSAGVCSSYSPQCMYLLITTWFLVVMLCGVSP